MVVKKDRVYGVDKVLKNLNKEILGIEGRTKAGLVSAVMFVESKAIPYTPIDEGHLRGSIYTDFRDSSNLPTAEIGYTAFYAVFVHEIDKNYKAPGTGWKYLERALFENTKKILQIIADKARIK